MNKKIQVVPIIVGIIIMIAGKFLDIIGYESNHRLDGFAGYFSDNIPYILMGLGVAAIVFGIALLIPALANGKKPIITRKGKIIEKSCGNLYDFVVIEFDDGTRKKLSADKDKIIVSVGDEGEFDIQGNFIIGLSKLK